MKKSIIVFTALIVLSLLSSAAFAGIHFGGIENIKIQSGDIVLVYGGVNRNDKPACANSSSFAFKLDTQAGRAMYAALLTAQMESTLVFIEGDGTCSVTGENETAVAVTLFTL